MTSLTAARELATLALLSPNPVTIGSGANAITTIPKKEVHLGSSLLRKFVCVAGCGACCRQLGPLTLDFVPQEQAWFSIPDEHRARFTTREIVVNGRSFAMLSMDKPRETCTFLNPTTQGCNIWQTGNPLGCSASARIQIQKLNDIAMVLKKGFSREWRWHDRAQCQYPPLEDWDENELDLDLKVLGRFQEWADYFEIETVIPTIGSVLFDAYQLRDASRLNQRIIFA